MKRSKGTFRERLRQLRLLLCILGSVTNSTFLTSDQRVRASTIAGTMSGGLKDPPGVLVPGPALGDLAIDPYEDVGAKSVDVLTVGIVLI